MVRLDLRLRKLYEEFLRMGSHPSAASCLASWRYVAMVEHVEGG
jgi:hypothetical protein